MVMDDSINAFFFFLLITLACFLVAITNMMVELRDFSRPYRELVETMCPETEPDVYIDSDKIIRIVYDCSQE